jgi:hypothetical protein
MLLCAGSFVTLQWRTAGAGSGWRDFLIDRSKVAGGDDVIPSTGGISRDSIRKLAGAKSATLPDADGGAFASLTSAGPGPSLHFLRPAVIQAERLAVSIVRRKQPAGSAQTPAPQRLCRLEREKQTWSIRLAISPGTS